MSDVTNSKLLCWDQLEEVSLLSRIRPLTVEVFVLQAHAVQDLDLALEMKEYAIGLEQAECWK